MNSADADPAKYISVLYLVEYSGPAMSEYNFLKYS